MSINYKHILNICKWAGLLDDEKIATIMAETARQTARATQEGLLGVEGPRSPLAVAAELDILSEEEAAQAVAQRYGVPYYDIEEQEFNPEAALKLSVETMRHGHCFPIALDETGLTLAMVDPADIVVRDDVRTLTRMRIHVVVSAESALIKTIERFEAEQTNLSSMIDEFSEEEDIESHEDSEDEDTVVAKLMNKIISDAINLNAGDIYVEPHDREMAIRFRIDGVCREIFKAPKNIYRQFINRLKIQCELDISERRIPQDGRFSVSMRGKLVDFRVAILPTIYGELAVMRLLRRDSIMLSLQDLGFSETNFKAITGALDSPHGMVLVTGPTGSGKSTTLYAAINETTDPELNLITVEDPVEYQLPGLSQVQIHEKAGMTFAAALRSILRQDPDQVMIGEIRDLETGKIAIEAALTGHLVLSTLHTNDAPSALTRLTEMGIEPFLTASAILLVVAQRLARRLCSECKEAYQLSAEACEKLGLEYDHVTGAGPTVYRAVGCPHCNGIGYKGRMGIHEVMHASEELERLIVRNASADVIREQAIKEGMLTLRQDGFDKVLQGLTSIEEILRVVA